MGRLQYSDESAVCRLANVGIKYCAEPFGNDGHPVNMLTKSLKQRHSERRPEMARACALRYVIRVVSVKRSGSQIRVAQSYLGTDGCSGWPARLAGSPAGRTRGSERPSGSGDLDR